MQSTKSTDAGQILAQADLSDHAERQPLADLCQEEGRLLDEKLLRALNLPVEFRNGVVCPVLSVSAVEPGWINTQWGTHDIGGCWVAEEAGPMHDSFGSLIDERASVGDLYSYGGSENTGGVHPDGEYFSGVLGFPVSDWEAEELLEQIEEASLRCGRGEMDRQDAEDDQRVQDAYEAGAGAWTGCGWSQPFEVSASVAQEDEDGETFFEDVRDAIDAEGLTGEEDSLEVAEEAMPPQYLQDDEVREAYIDAARSAVRYARNCASDAVRAGEVALQAINAFNRHDYTDALTLARQAVGIEGRYGDSPAWRGLANAIEAVCQRRGLEV